MTIRMLIVLQKGLAIWWWLRKKDKSVRLCLDPKPLNAAILRERYVILTPADVQSQLSGKRLFSVIDMKDGYWHVGLSEESFYLTTFHTPWEENDFVECHLGYAQPAKLCKSAMKPLLVILMVCM